MADDSSSSNSKEAQKPTTDEETVDDFLKRGLDKLSATERLAAQLMPTDERRKQLNAPLPKTGTLQMNLNPLEVGVLDDAEHLSQLQLGICRVIQDLNPLRCRIVVQYYGQLLCDRLYACFLENDQMFELLKRLEATTKPGIVAPGQPVCLFDCCVGGQVGNPRDPARMQLLYLGDYALAKRRLLEEVDWMHAQQMKTYEAEKAAAGAGYAFDPPVRLTEQAIARPGRIASGQEGSAEIARLGPSPSRVTPRQEQLAKMPEVPAPYPKIVLPMQTAVAAAAATTSRKTTKAKASATPPTKAV